MNINFKLILNKALQEITKQDDENIKWIQTQI